MSKVNRTFISHPIFMCFIFFELIVLSPTVSVINSTDKGQKVPTSKIVVLCCAQQFAQ